jgi:hypothetical protein
MAVAGPRRRIGCASALAGALAAIVAAVTLLGIQATRVQQSVNAAAAVGLRPATGPAPAPDPTDPRHERLAREVDGVHFPDWWPSLGWRAVGQRTDEIGRRLAVTVFYSRGHAQVAYTILASPALPQPRGPATRLNGIDFHTFAIARRPAVTWRRAGLTCVLTGERATSGELLQLAAWNQPD